MTFRHATSCLALFVFTAGFAASAQAAPFTITNSNTETAVQTLGADETGTANSGVAGRLGARWAF